jgi:CHAP domain
MTNPLRAGRRSVDSRCRIEAITTLWGMRGRRMAVVALAVTTALGISILAPPRPATAAVVPWGTVLVPGPAWAGAEASRGDLNVYSNGTGFQDQNVPYGLGYECVELAVRWAQIAFGDNHSSWGDSFAYQMWATGPRLHPAFVQHPNGGGDGPQFGDLIVFASTSFDPSGHVAVVSGTGPGYVSVVEQNYNNNAPTGHAQLPIYGTVMPNRFGLPILGWLRSTLAPPGWHGDAGPGGYLADMTGHVYPFGSATSPTEETVWPTQARAKAIALIPHTRSGYVLDSFGGLHAFGGAPRMRTTAYWFGQDMARAFVLTPGGKGGYVLDAYGGLHAFGDAPAIAQNFGWPGWDIARAIVLRADGLGGLVLDGYGGLQRFGTFPPVRLNGPYYPGQDIARAACLRSDGDSGWWVDGNNDIHSFGGAPQVASIRDFPGQDVARSIVCSDDGGGYTLTTSGDVLQFGDAVGVWSPTLPNSLASGLAT